MISYIFGSQNADKTNFIYNEIKERSQMGENSYILVPEQYSMFSERELLKRLGFSAQKTVRVLTFSKLSNLILSKMGPLRLKYIDTAGKNMLCRRAVQLLSTKLSYFTRGDIQSGFSSVLVKTFSEFKRYGITPEGLLCAADETENTELSAKLSDLKLLYEKYDLLLSENNSDAEDNLKHITPKIAAFDGLNGKFFVSRFKSFTPVEYEALFELMKKNDFTFSFFSDNLESSEGIFKSAANTYKTLKSFAEKSGIASNRPIFINEIKEEKQTSKKANDLEFLKENFSKFRPKTYSSVPENIELLRPETVNSEVNMAANLILRLVCEEDFDFEDITVLTGQKEVYEDIIPVVFEKNGINFFMDSKTPLASMPFTRFYMAVLEIPAFGFSYERIASCLKSGYLSVSEEDADLFENYLLAAGISDNHYQSKKPFSNNPDKKLFNLDKINALKEKIIDPLTALASLPGRKNVKKINEALFKWLSDNKIKQAVQKEADLFLKEGNSQAARETESAWNSLMTVTAQAESLFGDTPVTFKKYYEIISSAIADIKIGAVPPLLNQVNISETENFRTAESKVMIVLGCCEGNFPKNFSEDGLLSDRERRELEEKGLILAPGAYEKQIDEQLLVYSVLTAPEKKLILSAPIAANDGSELLCSEIFSDIKEIFPLLTEKTPSEENGLTLPECRDGALEALFVMLCKCKNNPEKLPPFWSELYKGFSALPDYKEKLIKFREDMTFEEERCVLDKETAKLLYGAPLMMSVSKLEKYNSCAFSYFLTYGLLIDERKKATLQSSDIGSALHKVLSVYFEEKKNENSDYGKITKKEVKKRVEEIIKDEIETEENSVYNASSYYKYMLIKIRDIATQTAWKIVRFYSQSAFRPYGFEIKIDKDGAFPPHTVYLKDGEAKIRGFIDRMDIYEKDGKKYFNIVDYKSSEKKIEPRLAELGVRFQPLLYAGIVEENIKNSAPAAMMYMKMDDPTAEFSEKPTDEELEKTVLNKLSLNGIVLEDDDILTELDKEYKTKDSVHFAPTTKGCTYSKEGLKNMIENALKIAEETSQKISDGDISINPVVEKSKFDACQYCKFASCCKVREPKP